MHSARVFVCYAHVHSHFFLLPRHSVFFVSKTTIEKTAFGHRPLQDNQRTAWSSHTPVLHNTAHRSFLLIQQSRWNLFWGKGRTSTHNFLGDVFNRGIDSLYWSYSVTPVDWNEWARNCGLNLWKHMTVIFRFVWRPWKIQYLNHSTWKTARAPSWYEEGHREYLISCSVEVLKKYKTGSGAVAKNLRNDVFQKLRLVRTFTRLNRSVKLGRSIISNVVGVKC